MFSINYGYAINNNDVQKLKKELYGNDVNAASNASLVNISTYLATSSSGIGSAQTSGTSASSNVSGGSGINGISGISGSSGASGISGSSSASGASGSKFTDWLNNQYDNTFKKESENKDTFIDDPLTIHSWLEPYRDRLYYYADNVETHAKYMDILKEKLVNYYSKNGLDGLKAYMDEFFDALLKEYGLDTKYAPINPDILFGDNEEISPKYLSENIQELIKSSSQEIALFGEKLDELIKNFNINNSYDQEDLMKCVIKLMNKFAGQENTYPVSLTRQSVEQLNQLVFFDSLDCITSSQELKDEYYLGVDGYVDDFGQGGTGDCWLLASIIALNSSEAGRQILKDSIKTDDDGNIIVTFKGIGISYTITPEEMIEARVTSDGINNSAYSNGDNDVQAIELATEKLRRDLANNNVMLPFTGYMKSAIPVESDDNNGGILYGGFHNDALLYLTGNTPDFYVNYNTYGISSASILDLLDKSSESIINGTSVGYFSLGNKNIDVKTVDGEKFTWDEKTYHAFAIVGMTIAKSNNPNENTITVVNPWYSDKTYTFTWETFAEMNAHQFGVIPTEIKEHNFGFDKKDEYGNTIDYASTINVSGKEYSINDILKSQVPLLYETKSFFDTESYVYEIVSKVLSDIQPDICHKIMEVLGDIYGRLANNLDLDDPNSKINLNGDLIIASNMANDFGVSKTDNGTVIDVRSVVQKVLDYTKTYLKESMSYEDYEEKLQGDEFDIQIDETQLKIYMNEYRKALFDNLTSKYEYNEEFIKLIKGCTNVYTNILERDENGKLNLKDALNTIKNKFDRYTTPPTEEITSYNIKVSWYQGDTMKTFINDIVQNAYNSNKEKIQQAKDLDDFKKQLIRCIALNFGMANELQKNGEINLANIIKFDRNGDGNWVDEFFQIVHDFAHKDDDAKINYYKKFELNGQTYSLDDILTSKDAGRINISNKEFLRYFIEDMVSSISEVLQNMDNEIIRNIESTLLEYYYKFADSSWDRETYYNDKDIEINNYITGKKENVHFDLSTAYEYGITGGNGYYVEIDIKSFAQKFLDLVNLALAES